MKFRIKNFHLAYSQFRCFLVPINNPWSSIIRVGKKIEIYPRFKPFYPEFHFNLQHTWYILYCLAVWSDAQFYQDWDQPRPQGQLSPAWAYLLIINRNVEKSDRVNEQNNTSAPTCSLTSELAVHMLKYIVRGHVCCPLIHHSFFLSLHYTMLSCPFLCRSSTTTISLLENGDGEAINSTISFWTRARSPLFSSNLNSLLLSSRATCDHCAIVWEGRFQWRFHGRRRCRI